MPSRIVGGWSLAPFKKVRKRGKDDASDKSRVGSGLVGHRLMAMANFYYQKRAADREQAIQMIAVVRLKR